MSFNEQNTIENALRDQLCGRLKAEGGRMNEGHESSGRYNSAFIPQPSSFPHPSSFHWQFVAGDKLPTYGKQPQDVFVDTWLKTALCRLNPVIEKNPDLAEEVIHRMRGVLLDAGYSGLVRANESFMEWLLGKVTMPIGVDGEHVTIHLIDFEHPENNLLGKHRMHAMQQFERFTAMRQRILSSFFNSEGVSA